MNWHAIILRAYLAILTTVWIGVSSATAAVHEQVLYTFQVAPDSSTPQAQLVEGAPGKFYGTAFGGTYNKGCVFEVSRNSDGTWTEHVLYSFSGSDGDSPAASLIFDAVGNLYGTTAGGGAFSSGVVFELSPSGSGAWTETVLHSFGSGTDGYDPQAELVFDAAGNLYGTTQFGGTKAGFDNGGTVFRLSPSAGGWTETLLYSFPGSYFGPDGDLPGGGVVIDKNGNIFGVAQAGGAYGGGAVYQLTPSGGGSYTESIIHSFSGTDGQLPRSTLIFDAAGNLYGTTINGGNNPNCPPNGCGTVFELKKQSGHAWAAIVLHAFNKTDGWEAVGPVVFDSAGNLYAAATAGGANGWGSVFKLTPRSSGPWQVRVLYNFGDNPDGAEPAAGVILNSTGRLFGTTSTGGSAQQGVVFEIGP